MIGLIVDTSVLHKANDPRTPENWDATSLLTQLPGRASVYIDAEDGILAEYRPLFSPGIQSFAFQWWQRQLSSNGVITLSGRLTKKEAETFARDGCDVDDRPFIGVALRANVPIVHEDSDYEEPCAVSLGIDSLRLANACSALGL